MNKTKMEKRHNIALKVVEIKEEKTSILKINEIKGNDNTMKDHKSQFEYAKMHFIEAIKYLKMSIQNGSSESSEFITKYSCLGK